MQEFNEHLAGHHGVFSRTEALCLGITKSQLATMVRRGQVVRTHPQVFRSTAQKRTWRSTARSAALSAAGIVSHRAAAAAWEIDGFPEAIVEITTSDDRCVVLPGVKIHRSSQYRLVERIEIDGLPVTGIARTILDLAAVVSPRRLEQAVDSAIRQGLVDWPELYLVLTVHSRRGRNGCGKLRAFLDVRYGDTTIPDSAWNRNVGTLLLDGGLPEPTYEHEILDNNGGFVARVDLAYPRLKIAIELDSVRWHLNRKSFEADPRRKNKLILAGWTVLTFTWSDYVDTPQALIDAVRQARSVKSQVA